MIWLTSLVGALFIWLAVDIAITAHEVAKEGRLKSALFRLALAICFLWIVVYELMKGVS